MIAPTQDQLRTLRLMAAGAEIRKPKTETGAYPITVNNIQVGIVRRKTMEMLVDAGWVQLDEVKGRWVIGHSGRAHVDVGAFVRAFGENA